MLIESGTISINLEEQLADFDYSNFEPFVFFEKKELLTSKAYNRLVNEIYSFDNFEFIFKAKGEKSKSSIDGNNVHQLKDGAFKDFCNVFLSNNFFIWFKKTHLPFFISNKKIHYYIKKPKNIIFQLIRKINKILKLPVRFFHIEVEYSSIKKGGYIPPHTDSKNKRLSFVFYLHSENEKLTDEMKTSMGTVFWVPKSSAQNQLRRFDCGLLDINESKLFYKNYEPIYIAKYEPNKFAGFIKSDNSWHTVEKFDFKYDRRAIVINMWES